MKLFTQLKQIPHNASPSDALWFLFVVLSILLFFFAALLFYQTHQTQNALEDTLLQMKNEVQELEAQLASATSLKAEQDKLKLVSSEPHFFVVDGVRWHYDAEKSQLLFDLIDQSEQRRQLPGLEVGLSRLAEGRIAASLCAQSRGRRHDQLAALAYYSAQPTTPQQFLEFCQQSETGAKTLYSARSRAILPLVYQNARGHCVYLVLQGGSSQAGEAA